MSVMEFSAEMTGTPIDHKALDPHFTLSENAKQELDTLFEAMEAVTLLAEAPENERGPDMETADFAAVYRALSCLGKRVMSDARLTFPAGLVKAAS